MEPWPIDYKNKNVGQVTSAAFSPDFQTNVALGMISRECWNEGDQVNVQTPDGVRSAIIHAKSFI